MAPALTFFNGHGGWCICPFLSFDREAEQYLCAAVLRLGKAVAADGTLGLLSRLLPLLRAAFPRARFLVPGSTGALRPRRSSISWMRSPGSTTWWRWRRTRCCSGMRSTQSEVGGETAHDTDTRYAARTWDLERRVVIKASSRSASETASRTTCGSW